MSTEKRHSRLYDQRRAEKEYYFGYPIWKRVLKSLERFNKRLWLRLFQLALRVRPTKGPLDPKQVNSVLFLRNDGIGDMVLTTPMFYAIKKYAPHIRVGVIGSFRNLEMLEHDPNVDVVYDCPQNDRRAYRALRRRLKREPKWDIIMPMMYYGKTKMAVLSRYLSPRSLSSMLVKKGESIRDRSRLFSIVAVSPFDTGEVPMIEQMRFHLTGTLNLPITDDDWRPRLYLDTGAKERVENRITPLLHADGTTGYIHVNLEAKSEFKEYGKERSLELSRELRKMYPDRSIVWTSSPVVVEGLEKFIQDERASGVHVIRTENVHELIAVVAGADLVVSPDTSVIHIASAEQKPVVGLYPVVHEWTPYKTPNRLLVPKPTEPVSTIPVADVAIACKGLLAV